MPPAKSLVYRYSTTSAVVSPPGRPSASKVAAGNSPMRMGWDTP